MCTVGVSLGTGLGKTALRKNVQFSISVYFCSFNSVCLMTLLVLPVVKVKSSYQADLKLWTFQSNRAWYRPNIPSTLPILHWAFLQCSFFSFFFFFHRLGEDLVCSCTRAELVKKIQSSVSIHHTCLTCHFWAYYPHGCAQKD